jgi:hypothetical protein
MITVEDHGEAAVEFFGYHKKDPNAKSISEGGKDF